MQSAPLPPNNLDAERSVLGAMLQDAEAVLLAQELLAPQAFYQPAHRELFDAMLSLSRRIFSHRENPFMPGSIISSTATSNGALPPIAARPASALPASVTS